MELKFIDQLKTTYRQNQYTAKEKVYGRTNPPTVQAHVKHKKYTDKKTHAHTGEGRTARECLHT